MNALRAHGGGAEHFLSGLAELQKRILISKNDDHRKNHGFLHMGDDGRILSPAFDTNPQPDPHRHLETGISPRRGTEASIEAAIEAAPFFEIDENAARVTALRMAGQVSEERQRRCRDAGMTAGDRQATHQHLTIRRCRPR